MSRFSVLLPILCGGLLALAAEEPLSIPHQGVDLPHDPSVLWGQLNNGLIYAIKPHQEPPGKVALRLFIRAGSLQETPAERGLAHYLEHMAFNGSEHFPPGTLIERLQAQGIGFGSHANAHTSFDETVYKLLLPNNEPETLDLGLQVMAETAGRLLLSPAETEAEKGVILAEMRDGDGPQIRTWRAIYRALFPGSTIGERFPIGLHETVAAADAAHLRAFYERWYRPDRMVLTIVGEIDPEPLMERVEAHFAAFEQPAQAASHPDYGQLQPSAEPTFLHHHEAEADNTRVLFTFVQEQAQLPDGLARRRLAVIDDLTMRVLDRRFQDLAEQGNTAPILSAGLALYRTWRFRITSVNGRARPDRALESARLMIREWRRLGAFGATSNELALAADNALAELDAAVDQQATRPSAALAGALYTAVDERSVFMTPEQRRDVLAPLYRSITSEDIRARLAERTQEGHLLLAVTGSEDLGAEAEQALRSAYNTAMTSELSAPQEQDRARWAYDTAPTAVPPSHQDSLAHGIQRRIYPNHVHLHLLPRTAKPKQILMQLRLHIPPVVHQPGLREFVSAAFQAGGLGAHSAAELREALAGTQARVAGPAFDEDGATFTVSCTPEEIERALQQLRAWIVDPGWRPEAAERAKTAWIQQLQGIEQNLLQATRRRWDQLSKGLLPQRRSATLPEAKALDLAQAETWFTAILRTAPIECAIVGDFDPQVTSALADAYLGSLPERQTLPVIPDLSAAGALAPAPPMPSGSYQFTCATSVRQAIVGYAWPSDDAAVIEQERRTSVLIGILREILRSRIREELGDAYSPFAFGGGSRVYADDGSIAVAMMIEPDRIDAVRAVLDAEIAQLRSAGIADDVFERVLAPIRQGLTAYTESNGYWLNQVANRASSQPQRLEWAANMIADYASMTAAEISDLARRYLRDDTRLVLISISPGPEEAVPVEEAD